MENSFDVIGPVRFSCSGVQRSSGKISSVRVFKNYGSLITMGKLLGSFKVQALGASLLSFTPAGISSLNLSSRFPPAEDTLTL